MDHKSKVIKELEEIAPNLASLKKDLKKSVVPENYFDKLASSSIKKEAARKQELMVVSSGRSTYIQFLTAIAASLAVLIGVWFMYQHTHESSGDDEIFAEAYMDDNLEEFDEYIINDLSEFEFDDQVLEDISEESIITYIEDNLDELDLEFFYD